MGDSFSSQISNSMCIGGKCFDLTHNQLRPMTTQTQATDQVLTDEQLEDLNGGGFWGDLGYIGANFATGGLLGVVDLATGGHAYNEFHLTINRQLNQRPRQQRRGFYLRSTATTRPVLQIAFVSARIFNSISDF